jgi:predicted nuclease with TOPRIM domain
MTARLPDWGKPTRIDTIGDDYTREAITKRIGIGKIISGGSDSGTHTRNKSDVTQISLLVDIQAKLAEGKGAGYEQWAHIFNVKQMAKTLVFLKENGIDSYEDLKKKSSSASGEFAALTKRIKEIETQQKKITELQKYIGQYGKTRDVYEAYRKSGWSTKFYEEHTADIILHRAAKKYFDALGKKKLPSINQLKQEYATLATERKKLNSNYYDLRDRSRQLLIASANADRILGVKPQNKTHENSHEETR